MADIVPKIRQLEQLAEASTAGDGKAREDLRKGIHALQLAVETPRETISRLNFQVRSYIMQSIYCQKIPTSNDVGRSIAIAKYMHSNGRGIWMVASDLRARLCNSRRSSHSHGDRKAFSR